jgi:DNA polymerase-3 subunit delta'
MGEEAGEKRTGSQSDRRMIKIDQVRELERYMGEMPFESPRKVALVLDAEMMNIQSQNAMLKTLEEPPGESLIVLTTAAPSSLPLTVLSRCLRILFPPLGEDAVASMLRAGGADPAQTEMLAHLSGGSAGRAAAIGGGVAWVLESIAGMSCVPGGTASWALELAAELGRGGRDRSDNVTRLLDLLDAFGIFLRDSAAGDFGSRWGMVPGLKTVAPDTATRCFPALDGARRALELHCNAQLVLESLFMKMREAASPGGE